MPRPKKRRWVTEPPRTAEFGPTDIPPDGELELSMEEMEAIRLSDFEKLDQDGAARLMGVSRQTYGRILAAARGRVAEALVEGKRIRIGGGHFALRGPRGGRRRRGAGHHMHTMEGATMPRGDGTGPNGKGAGGRGAGNRGGRGAGGGGGRGVGGGGGRGKGGGGKGGQGGGGRRSGGAAPVPAPKNSKDDAPE